MLNKNKLIEQILAKLDHELASIQQAGKAAHDAATHEESRAEDRHDTRGLESSYLAGAYASRIAELKQLIQVFRLFDLREFRSTDPIAPGALVELETKGRKVYYFLVTHGGGISIKLEGKSIQLITPQAPLGEELMGRKVGDSFEIESANDVREYTVRHLF